MYKDTDIIVSLAGGLGNRLHTLYSAHYLTMNYGLPLKYCWHDDFGSGCDFNDLFDDERFIMIKDRAELYNYRLEVRNSTITNIELQQRVHWVHPFNARLEHSTHSPDFTETFNNIKLHPSIIDEVNSIYIPENTFGIHVRGGDIKVGNIDPRDNRKYVPPETFFPTMDEILDDNNNQKFLLSCENLEDEELFINRYNKKNLIILGSCPHNRNSKRGIICGFINIILLSKCIKIFGMSSSFSSVSVHISNLPISKINF